MGRFRPLWAEFFAALMTSCQHRKRNRCQRVLAEITSIYPLRRVHALQKWPLAFLPWILQVFAGLPFY